MAFFCTCASNVYKAIPGKGILKRAGFFFHLLKNGFYKLLFFVFYMTGILFIRMRFAADEKKEM